MLIDEYDVDDVLDDIRGYTTLSPSEKMRIKLPYIHTTLLIDELVNLQHEESGGKVKIFEKSGMRKDRYSSLSYNYYVALQLENKLAKRNSANVQTSELFVIRPPSNTRKVVNRFSDKHEHSTWQ